MIIFFRAHVGLMYNSYWYNNVHTGLNVINVAELTSGIYIIKITTNTEKFSLNFEKE